MKKYINNQEIPLEGDFFQEEKCLNVCVVKCFGIGLFRCYPLLRNPVGISCPQELKQDMPAVAVKMYRILQVSPVHQGNRISATARKKLRAEQNVGTVVHVHSAGGFASKYDCCIARSAELVEISTEVLAGLDIPGLNEISERHDVRLRRDRLIVIGSQHHLRVRRNGGNISLGGESDRAQGHHHSQSQDAGKEPFDMLHCNTSIKSGGTFLPYYKDVSIKLTSV